MALTFSGVQIKKFDIDVASSTWTIQHNMGANPVADVRVTYGSPAVVQKVYPMSMEYTDENTIVIKWSAPRTGSVLLTTAQV